MCMLSSVDSTSAEYICSVDNPSPEFVGYLQ